ARWVSIGRDSCRRALDLPSGKGAVIPSVLASPREPCDVASRRARASALRPVASSVLLLTPWFPNRPDERQGQFIYASAAALARRGLSVAVLVARAWRPRPLQRIGPEWLRDAFEPRSFAAFREARLVRHLSIPRNHLRAFSNWAHDRSIGPVLEAMARD